MIEVENLCFTYCDRNKEGLKNINLRIEKGEFILICGASGSGKTSLTRVINKLIPDYFPGKFIGQVKIKGENVKNMPMYELSQSVGSVFQNPKTQFFNVDTNSEIVFGLENQGVHPRVLKNKLRETSRSLNLEALTNRNIFKLSGGEKQKIAFASVYAMNPDIFLLDEPSSNLDQKSIEGLKKHLELLKAQHKTVVVSEHRIYYLMDLVDRIIYMENGSIVKSYKKSEFLALSDEKCRSMGLRNRQETRINIMENSFEQGTPYIQLQNLSVFRCNKCILKDISLAAKKGDIVGVLGHNGIGKTTFLRVLCGLHNDCKGDIFINGKAANSKERIKKSYMVMQDVNYQLFAESVLAECKLGVKHVEQYLIKKILGEFDLMDYIKLHPNTLSGGQKQRLAIAVGFFCNKDVLVLDEPTSGLDYQNMLRTTEFLKRIAGDKVVFVATHDYEFVNLVCNKVINLEKNSVCN